MEAARILVTSARGGVGTSSSALHIASALAERGGRVLLADLRETGRSLDLLTSLSESAVYDLHDLLCSRIPPSRALLPVPCREGLWLLPGALGSERTATSSELCRALAAAEEAVGARFTVMDGGLDLLGLRAAGLAAQTVLVSDLSRASLRAATDALARLPRSTSPSLLLNRFPIYPGIRHPVPSVLSILDEVRLPLLGIVPDSLTLANEEEAGQGARLRAGDNLASAYRNIAARLTGGYAPLLSGWRGIRRHRVLRRLSAEHT